MPERNSGPKITKVAFTVTEAAQMLSLSRSRVYELLNTGEVESVKIGRSRRITQKQLAAYVARLELES